MNKTYNNFNENKKLLKHNLKDNSPKKLKVSFASFYKYYSNSKQQMFTVNSKDNFENPYESNRKTNKMNLSSRSSISSLR
jgi:hypothetical protein